MYEICTQGKFPQTKSREPDSKANKPLELVYTDLAGTMKTVSLDVTNMQSFTDDCSGAILMYFLKSRKDAAQAAEKFSADISP